MSLCSSSNESVEKRKSSAITKSGHVFTVISYYKRLITNKEALINKYHLENALASFISPKSNKCGCSIEEKYLETATLAMKEDMAEVIVLRCDGMTGLDKEMEKN